MSLWMQDCQVGQSATTSFSSVKTRAARSLVIPAMAAFLALSGSFDLYWIAVHKDHQGLSIGKKLLVKTEKKIKTMGGMGVYIETSSRDLYKPTQGFYLNAGYHQEATLKDYYSPGDSKIIYVKHL